MFAPTDDAFKALPAGALDNLIANPEQLKKVLLDHVVSGTVYSRGLPPSAAVKVVGGDSVQVNVSTRKLLLLDEKYKILNLFFIQQVVCLLTKLKLQSQIFTHPMELFML